MNRPFQVTFDTHDPIAVSRFWAEVLGYIIPGPPGVELTPDEDPYDAWETFITGLGMDFAGSIAGAAEDPDGTGPRLYFQKVPEDKTVKNRVHLDVRVAPDLDGDERMAALEAESRRLEELGGRRLRRFDPAPPLDRGHIVMADPEGNEFCLD